MAGANWWVSNYPGGVVGGPSAPAYGGGGADLLTARDPLDAQRMAAGFAPGSSWPDGYLGNITDRRDDKLAVLQTRLTSTSYQRGVHKGSKIGVQEYYWQDGFGPDSGLQRQMTQTRMTDTEGGRMMTAPRFSPSGDPVEMLAHDGKFAGASSRQLESELRARGGDPAKNPVTVMDPARAARMKGMMPRWSGVNAA